MEIVVHRRNTLADLAATPVSLGVEVDIRTRGDALIIHHDPFQDGEPFDAWLKEYRHGLLILNVKEEGLEDRLLALMQAHGIERFFFLDQSFPFLLRTALRGERRCAVRVSEYEPVAQALAVAHLVDWAWVDCFNTFPLSQGDAAALVKAGLRLCLVSPELHGRAETDIGSLRRVLDERHITPDAVCTKHPELWR